MHPFRMPWWPRCLGSTRQVVHLQTTAQGSSCIAHCCEQHASEGMLRLGSAASGRGDGDLVPIDEMQCKQGLDAYLPDGELQLERPVARPSAEFPGPSLGCEARLWDCSCSGSGAGQMNRGNSLPPRWRTLAGRPCSAARSKESSRIYTACSKAVAGKLSSGGSPAAQQSQSNAHTTPLMCIRFAH